MVSLAPRWERGLCGRGPAQAGGQNTIERRPACGSPCRLAARKAPFPVMDIRMRKRLFRAANPRARRIVASSACAYPSKNRDVAPAGRSSHAAARSHAGSPGEHVTEIDHTRERLVGALDRLRVDHPRRRHRIPAAKVTELRPQRVVDAVGHPGLVPSLEVPENGLPRREVMRSCRHEQPVRLTWRIASTIRRRSWIAGRPPGSAAGTIGAINSHWASVRSDGYGVGLRRFLRATTAPIMPPPAGPPRPNRTLSKHSLTESNVLVTLVLRGR
ncbi:hypothetical protein R1CP_32330 [Rhodococcus opacus]|uniref:Uncharacterized protein n=1 Tax=Rhodococcus opacus TaxID=37919 RepID=A0A1B1KEV8_RHOOP|nr:hypothetical protein R1CP_32330 [Rhodococcus opacus]